MNEFDRREMINDLVNDLHDMFQYDVGAFWENVDALQEYYCADLTDKRLAEIHEEVMREQHKHNS